MCNINLILKFIISFLFVVVIFLTSNYYLFWLVLFYLLLLSIVDRNVKSLLILFFASCVLLFLTFTSKIKLLVQVILVFDFFLLFLTTTSKSDREKYRYKYLYEDKKNRKSLFYNRYRGRVISSLKKKYSNEDIRDNVIKDELDRLYLYSKVRFYGYGNSITSSRVSSFTLYDLLFLITSIFVLILMILYR